MNVDVDKLLARVTETLGVAKAVEESTQQVLHPEKAAEPGRWSKRRAWGQPKHRQPAKRQVDTKARPLARCRRLPGRRRVRRVRRFTGPSGHRRRSDAELRKLLAQGAFAGWMEDNVRSALDSTDRAVIICASPSCSGMSMVQRDKAAETWAKHCHTHVHEHGERHERLTVPGLTGTKRHRRRMLRQVRRLHAANARRGLLAELRAHADAQEGWSRSDLDRFEMASRFWVGGTGNWDAATTTQWSATTGGAGGASVPTAADDVTFDGASGGGTVTITATANALSFTATAFTGALTFNAGLIVVNNVTLPTTAITIGGAFGFTISGASTFTSNGCTLTGGLAASTASSNITLADASRVSGTVALSFGTINTNGQTCTWGIFSSSNSNTRTLTLGSSAVTVTGGGTSWSAATTTNLTFSGASSTITLTGASVTFAHAGTAGPTGAFGTVALTGAGVALISVGSSSFVNFTRTGTAVKTDGLLMTGGPSVSGTLTLQGNSVTNRLFVSTGVALGTARGFTISGGVTQSISNVDFQDYLGQGGVNVAGTSIGDAGGNSGVTFTAAAPQTWQGTVSGSWSDPSKWTSRVPLPQDNVLIASAFSASQTITADMPRLGASIDFTGTTGSPAWTISTATVFYGSLTLVAAVGTVSLNANITWASRSSVTITMGGKSWAGASAIVVSGPGGTFTLQDSFTLAGQLAPEDGTFAANGQNVSIGSFNTTITTRTRAVSMGSGAWSITLVVAGTVWITGTTGFTLTVSTATVSFTSAPGSAATQTVTTGGVTMPNLTVNGGANLTTQFSDAFTTAGTITLTAGTLDTNSKTVTASALNVGNATTRTLTLGSSAITLTLAGNAFTRTALTSLSVTANTASVTLSGASSTFNGGTYNWNGLTLLLTGSGTVGINGVNTFATVTRTGTAAKTDALSLAADQTITGTFTATGNSVTNRLLVSSNTAGTARTITTAAVSLSNIDFSDIATAGAAGTWTGTSMGDALGNAGITFDTPATQFWVSGTGNWSDSTKWKTTSGGAVAGRVPLPQDTARFDANSFTAGSQVVTMDMARGSKDLNFTGATNSPKLLNPGTNGNPPFYGNVTLPSGGFVANTGNAFAVSGRSSQTFTSNGQTFGNIAFSSNPGGTYTLQDAINVGVGTLLNVATGTFVANDFAVTAGGFQASSGTASMGSGAWTLNGTVVNGSQAWKLFAGVTLTVSTAIVSFTGTSGSPTITTAAITMPSVTFNGAAGSWTCSDAFTTAGTITLTAGTWSTGNQTISCSIFSSNNSNTRTLTLGSSGMTISGSSTTTWSVGGSGMTLTANTSTITISGSSATFAGNSLTTYNNIVMSGSGTSTNISTGFTAVNFTRTGTASKTDNLATSAAFTVSGTLTLTGNSLTNRLFVLSSVLGTPRTITAAAVSLTNVDFQDITTAGAAGTWTGTSLGDALGNTGITFTVAVTRFGVVAGNWSSTATWSVATGGAGGASVPLPQDTVVLDASSAAGTYTPDMPRTGKDLMFTGFTRTVNWNTGVNTTMFGNLTLGSGMTNSLGNQLTLAGRSAQTVTTAGIASTSIVVAAFGGTYTLQDAFSSTTKQITVNNGTFDANGKAVTLAAFASSVTTTRTVTMGSGAWSITGVSINAWNTATSGLTLTVTGNTTSFTATSGTSTITTGGVTMPNVTQNGAGGTTQFADAFTTAGTITLTSGTLDTNSQTVSAATVNVGNATTRTLTMGSSAITVTGSTGWTLTATTSLTVTANTATVTASAAGAQVVMGGINYNGVSVVISGSGLPQFASSTTVANLTRTGTAVKTDGLSVGGNPTVTAALTITGSSVTNRILVQSSTLGTARTITAATVVSTNADWQDITAAGAASWVLSAASGGSGDALGNTGITFTTAVPQFWRNGTGSWSDSTHWSLTSGGGATGRVPLPQDAVALDASSGGGTATLDMPRSGANLTATGYTGTLSFSSVTTSVYGNVAIGAATSTTNNVGDLILAGRGSQTFTSSGRAWTPRITTTAFGGTYTLQDALAVSRGSVAAVNITTGTLDTNGQSVSLTATNSGGMTITGGTLTLGATSWTTQATTAGQTFWSVQGGSVNAGTSTINLTGATSNSRTFQGGGKTYYNLVYTVAASTGAMIITGSNTFSALTVTSEAGNAKTLTLPSATTTTVTTLTLTGASGSLLVLNSSTAASAATISSGGTVSAQFLSLQDQATAGASSPFTAYDSTRVSNVTGWSAATRSTFTGSSTPTGVLVRQSSRHLAGSSTPTGRLVRAVCRHLTGSSTPAGTLANVHWRYRSMSGSSTPVGSLVRAASRHLAGSSTPTGVVRRSPGRHLAGSSTPTGVLRRTPGRHLTGSSTPTGTLATVHALLTTATAARVRAGAVAGARLLARSATAARARLGRATTQTNDPDAVGRPIRWRFDDPLTGDTYTFQVNPQSQTVDGGHTITVMPTTAADGDPLQFEGDDGALTGQVEAAVHTAAQYATYRAWYQLGRPIVVTDDLGARTVIVLTKVSPVRQSTRSRPYRQQVTLSYNILSRISP